MAYPQQAIDPTIEKAMDETFVNVQSASLEGNRVVAELVRTGAASTAKIVDVVAASALLQNALPGNILANRAAAGQPQQLPTGGAVAPSA